jgi:hypothetical protein
VYTDEKLTAFIALESPTRCANQSRLGRKHLKTPSNHRVAKISMELGIAVSGEPYWEVTWIEEI